MKKQIHLNENELNKLIKESLKNILNEKTGQNSYKDLKERSSFNRALEKHYYALLQVYDSYFSEFLYNFDPIYTKYLEKIFDKFKKRLNFAVQSQLKHTRMQYGEQPDVWYNAKHAKISNDEQEDW